MTRAAILITHVRPEEKLLITALQNLGVEPDVILDRDFNFDLTAGGDQLAPSGTRWIDYDVIIERWQRHAQGKATLADDGRTFDALRDERQSAAGK